MKKSNTPFLNKKDNKNTSSKSLKKSPENKMFNLKYKTK